MINFKPRADETLQPAETNDKILFLDTDGDLKIKDDSSVVTTVATTTDVAAARPYKVYTALLAQSGTNAPVATVLENTLGGTPVWYRTNTGKYYTNYFSLEDPILTDKIVTYVSAAQDPYANSVKDSYIFYTEEDGTVNISTYTDGVLSDGVLADGDGNIKTPIEIRVYP